jgi:hypothetical protein
LGQQNCGSSPTSRLQRTAQAGFLLGWGQFGVGLARENVVKWGHAVGEVVLGVGLVFGQHLHGPPLKRGVGQSILIIVVSQNNLKILSFASIFSKVCRFLK